jgi:ribosome-associated toxin RatA of RatAB toxin-antitoxin module
MTYARDRLLRGALLANAAFSTLTGAASLLAAEPIGALTGLPSVALRVVGAALLPFAAGLIFLATRRRIDGRLALGASLADFGWVLGTPVVLALVPVSSAGAALLGAIAVAVAVFGALQLVGLRRTVRSDGGGPRTVLVASRVVDVSPERAWEVVSDLAGYAEVAPNLSFSRVIGEDTRRAGLERECGDHRGGRWRETCTLWDEGRAYGFRVHTDAPDYPYPFRELEGRWAVERAEGGARVGMRFAASMPGGWLGDLMLAAVLAPRFEQVLDDLFDNWETRMRGGA